MTNMLIPKATFLRVDITMDDIYVSTDGRKMNRPETLRTLAQFYMARLNLVYIIGTTGFHVWNGCSYQSVPTPLIYKSLFAAAVNLVPLALGHNNYMSVIKTLRNIAAVDNSEFNTHDNYIPLLNGYFNIDTLKMEGVQPKLKFTYNFDLMYQPSTKGTLFQEKLEEILPDKLSRDRLLIYMAYCLTSSVKYQKALMMYGNGSNGKSFVMEVLHALIGLRKSTLVDLQKMGEKFNRILYMGKLVNFSDDLSKSGLADLAFFKTFTGFTLISGQFKGETPIVYTNKCKLICGCNMMPPVPDDTTDAFWRRWVIIVFRQTFKGDKRITGLHKMITDNPTEMKGALAYIMSFLPRLDELIADTSDETKSQWHKYGDAATVFHYKFLSTPSPEWINPSKLYTWFKIWCKANNMVMLSQDAFSKRLSKLGVVRKKRSGNKQLAWNGGFRTHSSTYWTYDEIYPNFPPEVEKLLGIKRNENGFYEEIEDVKLLARIDEITKKPLSTTQPKYFKGFD